MADHSIGVQDELWESESFKASCFVLTVLSQESKLLRRQSAAGVFLFTMLKSCGVSECHEK